MSYDTTWATPHRIIEAMRVRRQVRLNTAMPRPVRMSLRTLLVAPRHEWLILWLDQIAEYQQWINSDPERKMAVSLGEVYARYVAECAASLRASVHSPAFAVMACLLFLMANQEMLAATLDAKDCHFVQDVHAQYGTWLTGKDRNGRLYTSQVPARLGDANTVQWVLAQMHIYRRVYNIVPGAR